MFDDTGKALRVGKNGEARVLEWLYHLQRTLQLRDVIDMREFRISQRLDIDCGVETPDDALVTAEIKTDNHIAQGRNFLFELFRINYHLPPDKVFYLGWAFRSPAKYLLYYSPREDAVYRFLFATVRATIASYTQKIGRGFAYRLVPVLTDRHRLTVNVLVPQDQFSNKVKKYQLTGIGRLRIPQAV